MFLVSWALEKRSFHPLREPPAVKVLDKMLPSSMDINRIVEKAEQNLLSTTPGAVPPHVDDGGHLPYGGTIGGTRGPSAFGKKRLTTKGSLGNPQAQLLNYPPEASAGGLGAWERNCAPPTLHGTRSTNQIPCPSVQFSQIQPTVSAWSQTRARSGWTLQQRRRDSSAPTIFITAPTIRSLTLPMATRHGATSEGQPARGRCA
jgi:hypothetical protein